MSPSTHTTGGHERRCPVCGNVAKVDPSAAPGDAPCPFCGSLLWFRPAEPTPPSVRNDRKAASKHYRAGVEALEKQNWFRAIELFRQCVDYVPENVMFRQLLRNCEYKHLRAPSRVRRLLRRKQLKKLQDQVQAARGKKDWDAVDRAAERALAVDSWNVEMNAALGEAAEQRGMKDVAIFGYVSALREEPNREDLKERLAEFGYNADS